MKVSDIIMQIMKIICWGIKEFCQAVLEIYREALKIKI